MRPNHRHRPTPEQLARLQAARAAYWADPVYKGQSIGRRNKTNKRKRDARGKFAAKE